MKITFILPNVSFAGGIRVAAIYANHLKQKGHLVNVISIAKPKPSLRQCLASFLRGKGWPPSRDLNPSYFDYVDVPHQIVDARSFVTDGDVPDADVVIATWWETAEWVSKLSPSKGAKAYFIQGYEVFEGLPQDRVLATYRLPLKKITVSKWLADLMRDTFGDPDVSLVPNSVDTRQFYSPPRPKQRLPTVGMLYSKTSTKGCKLGLEAYSNVARRIPDLRLVAFGAEEPDRDLPLPKGARFYKQPAQQSLKDIFAQCDVWLCSSFSEGFHLPILEAMACRCPIVSTAVGISPDIIDNGVNGHVVPIGNVTALEKKLCEVLSLPDDRWQLMSEAAYRSVEKYTWEDSTALFEAALKKML